MVTQLKGCVSLVSILGISWLSGFFYFTTSLHWVGVLFTITNSLQVISMVIRAVNEYLRSFKVESLLTKPTVGYNLLVVGASRGTVKTSRTFVASSILHQLRVRRGDEAAAGGVAAVLAVPGHQTSHGLTQLLLPGRRLQAQSFALPGRRHFVEIIVGIPTMLRR